MFPYKGKFLVLFYWRKELSWIKKCYVWSTANLIYTIYLVFPTKVNERVIIQALQFKKNFKKAGPKVKITYVFLLNKAISLAKGTNKFTFVLFWRNDKFLLVHLFCSQIDAFKSIAEQSHFFSQKKKAATMATIWLSSQ